MISNEMTNLATIHSRYHSIGSAEGGSSTEYSSKSVDWSIVAVVHTPINQKKEARKHRSSQFLRQGYEMLNSVVSSTGGEAVGSTSWCGDDVALRNEQGAHFVALN